MFKILKMIGVELTCHHRDSLNGKDIRKAIDNAVYVSEESKTILNAGKKKGCTLGDGKIDDLCE